MRERTGEKVTSTCLRTVLMDVAWVRNEKQHIDIGEGLLYIFRIGFVRCLTKTYSVLDVRVRNLVRKTADQDNFIPGNILEEMSVGTGAKPTRGWEYANRQHRIEGGQPLQSVFLLNSSAELGFGRGARRFIIVPNHLTERNTSAIMC